MCAGVEAGMAHPACGVCSRASGPGISRGGWAGLGHLPVCTREHRPKKGTRTSSAGVQVTAGMVTQVYLVLISVPREAVLVPTKIQATFPRQRVSYVASPANGGPAPSRLFLLFILSTLRWVRVQLGFRGRPSQPWIGQRVRRPPSQPATPLLWGLEPATSCL